MRKPFIPLSVPSLQGNELKYVTEAIETEWVSTAGPYIQQFEEKVSGYVKAKGAVAVQNGTAGLHTALQLLGVSSADEVIVPTLTFIAAVNPIKYCGADPIFMDCDDSLGLDPHKLQAYFEKECVFQDGVLRNKSTDKTIKAIVVVHVFGNLADMEGIMKIAERYQLPVIEDATEALGSYYTSGRYAQQYAGTIGTLGVYSFNGNKIITTGGGGMIVSNNIKLIDRARYLTTQAKRDSLYYIHDDIGFNYRMTNIQAALGIAQLEQLETFIETKKQNYFQYKKELAEVNGLNLLSFRKDTRPNYWFYAIEVDKSFGHSRHKLIELLGNHHIQARPIWDLIHQQIPYKKNCAYTIETAPKYLESVINLPCSSNLAKNDVSFIVATLKRLSAGIEEDKS